MTDATTDRVQPGCKVDEDVWQRFRQDVRERHGGVRGHLRAELETALREYIDASRGGDLNDRLARLEQRIEQLDTDGGGGDSREGEKRKNERSVSSEVENKLSRIVSYIEENTGKSPKVHEAVVDRAIETHAGASDPTLRRYKELLESRERLYPHPIDTDRWFLDGADFAKAANALAKGGKLSDDTYESLVNRYGAEWWGRQVDNTSGDGRRGFQ